MNYIYDVLANFSDKFFDFYDWNEDDNIIHIKKLPILKVSSNFFYNVMFNSVRVDNSLLERIYRKSEFFKVNKGKYSYVCALCDGRCAFIVRFDYKGNVIGKSSMLIDEENEVVDISECMNFNDYELTICSKNIHYNFSTRSECQLNSYIVSELNSMDYDKLYYLYFDCFDEHECDTEKINNRLLYEINNNFGSIYGKIFDFLKLTSINK